MLGGGVGGGGAQSSRAVKAALSYCVEQVRTYDYHHYLCLLHLPSPMRGAAFALRAFNVETSRAMDVASDPKIGLLRLLWWQKTLDNIFSNDHPIPHPTALALSASIPTSIKPWLKRSVAARIADAENSDPPPTIREIEAYAESTVSTILYATLQAGGIRSTSADHAASHIGKASGILLLLKSLPYHLNRTRTRTGTVPVPYMPADVVAKHGVGEGLSDAVLEVATVARAHLEKARELRRSVPEEAKKVLLPAVPVEVLLDSLERVEFDVFDSRLGRGVLGTSPLWFQMKLNWRAWKNEY